MNKRLNELYNTYQNFDVSLNPNVSHNLHINNDKLFIKYGDVKIPCIIYSMSLTSARIILKMSESQINYLRRKKGALSLYLSFKDENEKNNISFYINSKATQLSVYNENKPDFYYCSVEYLYRAPDDLIQILGEYIDRQENLHKRAEERFILDSKNANLSKSSVENIFFVNGKGKRCILTEISMFSAKIILVDRDYELRENAASMLLIKHKKLEGLGEMLGSIERVDLINQEESLYSVIICFDQEMIPPSYKMWVGEFLSLVQC